MPECVEPVAAIRTSFLLIEMSVRLIEGVDLPKAHAGILSKTRDAVEGRFAPSPISNL
jgi:hypothetical protein